jgi:hypothetical protein
MRVRHGDSMSVRAAGSLDFWDGDRSVLINVAHRMSPGQVNMSTAFDEGIRANPSRS